MNKLPTDVALSGEFSKDVLQYARRRGEEPRSLIWINKGAIIRGAFGDSFTRHIFASCFTVHRSRCGKDAFIRERSAVKLREHGLIHGDRRRRNIVV